MKMLLIATVVAATLGVGAVAIAAAPTGSPGASERSRWSADVGPGRVLDRLVDEGVLTDEQADAVREGMRELRRAHRRDHPHGHRRPAAAVLDVAAAAIGITGDELRSELAAGASIAEVAERHGVDADTVVDALVEAGRERLERSAERVVHHRRGGPDRAR